MVISVFQVFSKWLGVRGERWSVYALYQNNGTIIINSESNVKEGMPELEGSDKPAQPGSGIRSTRTTSVFRAVNFELFATPVSFNRPIKSQDQITMFTCREDL